MLATNAEPAAATNRDFFDTICLLILIKKVTTTPEKSRLLATRSAIELVLQFGCDALTGRVSEPLCVIVGIRFHAEQSAHFMQQPGEAGAILANEQMQQHGHPISKRQSRVHHTKGEHGGFLACRYPLH